MRNILKENSTYTNDSWEKTLLSLTIRNITGLANGSLRLPKNETDTPLRQYRRVLSQYLSHKDESIYRGYPNQKVVEIYLSWENESKEKALRTYFLEMNKK